jgi:two-component system cell cycle response regulator DivK
MMTKVLVVEDNDLNLKLFNDLLTARGYEVLISQEGHDAFDIAKDQMPELILLDIQLKTITGIDIVKRLKSYPKTAKIPVIAVTAHAMKNDKQRFLNAGCDMYLPKPLSIDSLYQAIDLYIGK